MLCVWWTVLGIGYVDKILYCLSIHNRIVGVETKVSLFTSLYELVDDRVWLRYGQRVKVRVVGSKIENKEGLFCFYGDAVYDYVVRLDKECFRLGVREIR